MTGLALYWNDVDGTVLTAVLVAVPVPVPVVELVTVAPPAARGNISPRYCSTSWMDPAPGLDSRWEGAGGARQVMRAEE